jgi:hypothetical protein
MATLNRPTVESLESRNLAEHLADLESRLVAEYAGRPGIPESEIHSRFAAAYARFSTARIHAYIPILVERAVRAELDR